MMLTALHLSLFKIKSLLKGLLVQCLMKLTQYLRELTDAQNNIEAIDVKILAFDNAFLVNSTLFSVNPI